jgi:tRNA acetyltransferase TAN1
LKQFAIRPSIRNNNTLKRDVIINRVAGLINNQRHKVDLEKPDKVILIEVYQVFQFRSYSLTF